MSNWIFTQKGAVLKSEINALFPQYVENIQRFQVVVVLKNGVPVIIFENLASYDLAMVIIDKVLEELDPTYKPVMPQSQKAPAETPTKESTPELKKTNGKQTKKVKDNEDVE